MAFVKYLAILTVCVGALAIAVHAADELKQCIYCADHDKCNDQVDPDQVTRRCNITDGSLCTRYSFKDSTGTVTVRECIKNTTTCESQRIENKDNIRYNNTWSCYTCETDLCNKDNSAGSIEVSVVAMVATVLFSVYFK